MKEWFKKFRTEDKKNASFIARETVGEAQWTPRDYRALSREGYQHNVIVYRAVNLISRGISGVRWEVSTPEGRCEVHPLKALLSNPHPHMTLPSFMERLTSYLLLSGNAYVEMLCPDDGAAPLELNLLRPDRVHVMSHQGNLVGYEYKGEGKARRVSVDPIEGTSKILHLKLFHPLNDWYGMSPLEAAARAIDQHNAVSGHNLSLLQNGGRPSGALKIKGDELLTASQRDDLREEVKSAFQGGRNAGQVLVLEGDVEWKELGLSPKDMDFIEGKYLSAREIAQAFGVPPMLVGVPGDATFSNYREARYHLWEDTILPLMEKIKEELNGWLSPYYEGAFVHYDTDSIPALAPKRETTWAKVAEADFLSLNEKRRAIGYPSVENGDGIGK